MCLLIAFLRSSRYKFTVHIITGVRSLSLSLISMCNNTGDGFTLIGSPLMYREWFTLSADNGPITNLHVKVNRH